MHTISYKDLCKCWFWSIIQCVYYLVERFVYPKVFPVPTPNISHQWPGGLLEEELADSGPGRVSGATEVGGYLLIYLQETKQYIYLEVNRIYMYINVQGNHTAFISPNSSYTYGTRTQNILLYVHRICYSTCIYIIVQFLYLLTTFRITDTL